MQLTVLHYHFRPGGVRRVIETGLPALVREAGGTRVVLASGEAPDERWRIFLEAALFPCPVEWVTDPALGYWSEQAGPAEETALRIREILRRVTVPDGILWAHNLSAGRNMLLSREVAGLPGKRWLHHHDWWWDGRWERWPEMAAQGIDSLAEALRLTLPDSEGGRHFCINAADARRVREWTGLDVAFLPNPGQTECAGREEVESAREFLRHLTGTRGAWVYPCRALRRKNLAEALLVQRWLAPESATVTTGEASSPGELAYLETLKAAALHAEWPLHTGVCARSEAPSVPALIAAAEVVAVTSLREGFGLPYQEASAAGRPLLARLPPGVEETLGTVGFRFHSAWKELLVPGHFYDRAGESSRVAAGRERWAGLLPGDLRSAFRIPARDEGATIDFGRLTLQAQLEVLSHPPETTREASLPLNPVLGRSRAPQPRAEVPWRVEEWARAMVRHGANSGPSSLPGAAWPQEAVRRLTPLVQNWLAHPLLW